MGSFSLKFLIFLQLMNFSSIISLNIFPIPIVPVLCLKNAYLQRWKLWMHFLYLFNFFSILPDFFLHIHREFLFSPKSTIQSSFMLNCYLAHPLNFFILIFKIFPGSLPFFSATMITATRPYILNEIPIHFFLWSFLLNYEVSCSFNSS